MIKISAEPANNRLARDHRLFPENQNPSAMSGSYGSGGSDRGGGGYSRDSGGGGGYSRDGGGYSRDGGGGYGGNSQNRGGGDRGSRGGGGGGGGGGRGGGREGDWVCPNASCGNVNFARRSECNKCATPSPSGGGGGGGGGGRGGGGYSRGGDYNSGGGGRDREREGGGGGYNRGGGDYSSGGGVRGGYSSGGGGDYNGNRGGRSDNYGGRGGSYADERGRDDGGYAQVPPPAQAPYTAPAGGYPPAPNAYGSNSAPPVAPTYGAPPPSSYGSGAPAGRGGPPSYDGGYGGRQPPARDGGAPPRNAGGGYGGAPPPAEAPSSIKQCDSECGDTCDNSRIYISNLPPDVTVEELRELFGGIGQVGRIKQKRGYKDQWPWNIKIYTDDSGKMKGDAVLTYEDPSAAHSAGGFYNQYDMRGYKINVSMAEKTALRAPPAYGQGGGRGGYGGGGDRRRDNYRDGGGSGPDRHQFGGQRSRPY